MFKDVKGSISVGSILLKGILAISFTPLLMGAPSKARNAEIVSDLYKIQEAIVNAELLGDELPQGESCISQNDEFWFKFFDGDVPTMPNQYGYVRFGDLECEGEYLYSDQLEDSYSFLLASSFEYFEYGNIDCEYLEKGNFDFENSPYKDCYVILTK